MFCDRIGLSNDEIAHTESAEVMEVFSKIGNVRTVFFQLCLEIEMLYFIPSVELGGVARLFSAEIIRYDDEQKFAVCHVKIRTTQFCGLRSIYLEQCTTGYSSVDNIETILKTIEYVPFPLPTEHDCLRALMTA